MTQRRKGSLKTVLITGGGSGIGYETARQLLTLGDYRVILLGKNKTKLDEAVKSLEASPDLVSAYSCDLVDAAQVKKTVSKITAAFPTIYGLVNNAGVYPFGGVRNTTEKSWDETFAVNLKSPFLLIQALIAALTKSAKSQDEGARIVNVSSTAGILPNHFALAYSVSKAALIQLTRTLAKELGKDQITVNCVCPGIVRTPLHDAYHSNENEVEKFYAKRGSHFPLERVGEPKDVAAAILYFLSENAAWVTGDVHVVDGGRLLL